MSFQLLQVLDCDHPGCILRFHGRTQSVIRTRKQAKATGWVTVIGETRKGTERTLDFCPRHKGMYPQ